MLNHKVGTNSMVRGSTEFVAGPENAVGAAVVSTFVDHLAERERLLAEARELEGIDHRTAANASAQSAKRWAAHEECRLLVLCGQSGTGKTLLAHNLSESWRRRRPLDKVICASGSDFAHEFAEAVENRGMAAWRARHRAAALLVIDDLAPLANKPAAQAELASTLDALDEQLSQVIVTTRTPPQDMSGFSAALRSRLSAGLLVRVAATGPEARRTILERVAAARGIDLPADAARTLAQQLDVTAPELLGVVARLEAEARLAGRGVTLDDAQGVVAERAASESPSPRAIASETARHFSLRLADLKGPSRRRGVVQARDVAMYLMRQMTDRSLEQIGRFFGGRDHTTVLHGCRKIDGLLDSDAEIRRGVKTLRQRLSANQAANTADRAPKRGRARTER